MSVGEEVRWTSAIPWGASSGDVAVDWNWTDEDGEEERRDRKVDRNEEARRMEGGWVRRYLIVSLRRTGRMGQSGRRLVALTIDRCAPQTLIG